MAKNVAYATDSPSVNIRGTQGLNVIPTARMDAPGRMRAGISHSDPYNHAFIGFQVAKPLYVNLRQTMEVSSAGEKPSMVYSGVDLRVRLYEEGRYIPDLTFGMDSLLGDRRFSSEYFVLSKRFYDFDVSAGFAWGRLGSAGNIPNPFGKFIKHFDQDRDYDSHDSASPADMFTGKEIGFFAGVEYKTPIEDLSLKLDFNADAYKPERGSSDYSRPSPWSFGFDYSPRKWVTVGASVTGLDKIMARLTFQGNIHDVTRKSHKDSEAFRIGKDRPDSTWRYLAREMGESEDLAMGKTRVRGNDFSGVLYLNDYQPSVMQVGRTMRHLSANAGRDIETLSVIPVSQGVRGSVISINRRDLEQAVAYDSGSPEEIWRNAAFGWDGRSVSQRKKAYKIKLHPELDFSPIEEETTHLYRASLLLEEMHDFSYGLRMGSVLRLNVADNLHRLWKFRTVDEDSVRGDADLFTQNRVNVDRAFLSWMKTPIQDFHFAATAGYLEEMYAGYGGEVLWRPFKSPFSIGAEGWNVYKRDGLSPLALGIFRDHAFTGHANLFYDIPDTDITAFAKVGRFIGGDVGVTGGAEMRFGNGVKAKAYATVTNSDDKDVFGSDRNMIAGLQLSIPLGDIRFVPQGSEARVNVEPIGRDDGATLDKPVSLYDVTEPMSYRRLARNWQAVLE